MWVITDRGFYSAVQDDDDPDTLVIRARVRTDLVELCKILDAIQEPPKIIHGGGTDYPFRVRIPRGSWTFALGQLADGIDYGNFKDSVKARQGKARANVLMGVWSRLIGLEQLTRGGRRRSRRTTAGLDELTIPWPDDPDERFAI